jgi:hypothetical protein
MIALVRLPMPPSSNHMYPTIYSRGGSIRVKSKGLKDFETAFRAWSKENIQAVMQLIVFARKALETPGLCLHIDTRFYFNRKRVLTLKGTPKRLDTSNYLKALHDSIAQASGIDDSYFWNGAFSKIPISNDAQEYVNVYIAIQPMQLTTDVL